MNPIILDRLGLLPKPKSKKSSSKPKKKGGKK